MLSIPKTHKPVDVLEEQNADLSVALSTFIQNTEDEVNESSETASASLSDSESDVFDRQTSSNASTESKTSKDSSRSSDDGEESAMDISDNDLSAEFGGEDQFIQNPTDGSNTAESEPYGFTFCWDNVGKKSRHQKTKSKREEHVH